MAVVKEFDRKARQSHLIIERKPTQGFSISTASGEEIHITINKVYSSKDIVVVSIRAPKNAAINRDELLGFRNNKHSVWSDKGVDGLDSDYIARRYKLKQEGTNEENTKGRNEKSFNR